jgi:hypothetical protein
MGYLVASFDNVMALFVVVFALDFAITCALVRRVLRQITVESRSIPIAIPVPMVTATDETSSWLRTEPNPCGTDPS